MLDLARGVETDTYPRTAKQDITNCRITNNKLFVVELTGISQLSSFVQPDPLLRLVLFVCFRDYPVKNINNGCRLDQRLLGLCLSFFRMHHVK